MPACRNTGSCPREISRPSVVVSRCQLTERFTRVPAAIASLVFLVVIHKLEYFLNARIVGTSIESRAWELLAAMVAIEAVFGIYGLIAAPIYYAYVKDELMDRELV